MVFYYSPVLTSQAVGDDADSTQGPLGRAVRISAGSLGSLPSSCTGATATGLCQVPTSLHPARWGEMGEPTWTPQVGCDPSLNKLPKEISGGPRKGRTGGVRSPHAHTVAVVGWHSCLIFTPWFYSCVIKEPRFLLVIYPVYFQRNAS